MTARLADSISRPHRDRSAAVQLFVALHWIASLRSQRRLLCYCEHLVGRSLVQRTPNCHREGWVEIQSFAYIQADVSVDLKSAPACFFTLHSAKTAVIALPLSKIDLL
jgi:hypothetical protein